MSEPQSLVQTGLEAEKCPKCGYTRDPESEECPACGVVFSRFRPREIREDFNPYAPPSAAVGQPLLVSEALELADRAARLGARIVDAILIVVAVFVAAVPLAIAGKSGSDAAAGFALLWMPVALLGLLSWNLVWLHRYGQTPGKRLVNVRIVRSNGERVSLGRIIGLRWLVPAVLGSIPYLGVVFALVNILFIFRDDRRCIHDHLADTIVVTAPPEPSLPLVTVR